MRPKKAEAKVERDTRAHVETCPFCTGNEAMTPPAIASYPAPGGWQVVPWPVVRGPWREAARSNQRRREQTDEHDEADWRGRVCEK